MTVLKGVRQDRARISAAETTFETTVEIVCAIRCAGCHFCGLCSSIRRIEGAKIRQTIVTGRELRLTGGENTREILPGLSFGKDGMAFVQLCGSLVMDDRERRRARTRSYESLAMERIPSGAPAGDSFRDVQPGQKPGDASASISPTTSRGKVVGCGSILLVSVGKKRT